MDEKSGHLQAWQTGKSVLSFGQEKWGRASMVSKRANIAHISNPESKSSFLAGKLRQKAQRKSRSARMEQNPERGE